MVVRGGLCEMGVVGRRGAEWWLARQTMVLYCGE